jgi:two-component system sensor kinase FixL
VRDGDHITGILLQGQDVTEEVHAQERVQLLQNNLIHLSRVNAMATMASVLAHELNQPITAALNFLRGARRVLERSGETVPALASSGLESAEECVMRAGEIIRRTRTMVATGEVLTERHDVAELVDGALQLALLGARDANVTVEANLPPGLAVLADRTQIEQVVLNIVRNAIEAMANAPRRRLSIAAEAAGETIEIRIADSGPGLSAEVHEHLFDPFFTSKAEGMGVGMSISRTIVEAHGGQLWAENGPDGGALFRFTLPAAGQ